jgi:dihydropteroate synthase
MAARHHFEWSLRTRTLALGARTLIMGILNVTPDSFSDGGHFYSPDHATDRALTQALSMLNSGAEILDIGGESTRPNATPLTPTEEQSRVLPVIEAILTEAPQTILSVDTFHASTAKLAIELGAEIVNDVSGHTWDPAMSATCAGLQCGAILMHARGTPQTWRTLPPLAAAEILPLVRDGLTQSVASATAAGLSRNHLVIDPGFGFGKIGAENLTLLAHLHDLNSLNLPILAGLSRKSFLSKAIPPSITPDPADTARDQATIAANTAAILAGAHILRVHNVSAAHHAAAIADALLAARN